MASYVHQTLAERVGVQLGISQDLANEAWRNIVSTMVRNHCCAAVIMPKKDMTSPLPNPFEAVLTKQLHDSTIRHRAQSRSHNQAPTDTVSTPTK